MSANSTLGLRKKLHARGYWRTLSRFPPDGHVGPLGLVSKRTPRSTDPRFGSHQRCLRPDSISRHLRQPTPQLGQVTILFFLLPIPFLHPIPFSSFSPFHSVLPLAGIDPKISLRFSKFESMIIDR